MTKYLFPGVTDIVRQMLPKADVDQEGARLYARALNLVHCLWGAMGHITAKSGDFVSEELYSRIKTIDGIEAFIAAFPGALDAESLDSYLSYIPGYRAGSDRKDAEAWAEIERHHARVVTQIDIAVLACLPPAEVHRRLTQAQQDTEQLRHRLLTVVEAARPFIEAFEVAGRPSYLNSELANVPDFVKLLDGNRVVPTRQITMREFRLLWAAVKGKSAIKRDFNPFTSGDPAVIAKMIVDLMEDRA